jgi:predicted component of type VI protein secretion system
MGVGDYTVTGTLTLLSKSHVPITGGVAKTGIRPAGNNPLTFAPSVEAALDTLLFTQNPSFMLPEQAMGDAYDVLVARNFGILSAMRM